MKVVTAKQMAMVEGESDKLGVSPKILMGNAGEKIAERVCELCSRKKLAYENVNIVFLAGGGNNGGDCFAATVLLVYRGFNVTVVNLVKKPSTDIAKYYFSQLPPKVNIITGYKRSEAEIESAELEFMTMGNSITPEILLKEKERVNEVKKAVLSADILIDGVFGTGFHGNLDNELADIFSTKTKAYKIAVDIPSGGDSSRGTVSEGTFKADETICLGCLKFGLTQYPLKKMCGTVCVADIGIPREAYDILDGEESYHVIDRETAGGFPKKRESDSHKGNFGNLLVIGGSSSMRGAAVLNTLAALRCGVGLVKVASVEKCVDTVSILAPEATFAELESDMDGFMLFDDNMEIISGELAKAKAVVIGSGMGVTNDTAELVRFVVKNAVCPVVIDADGLNCIARDEKILAERKSELILTPHPAEMARLCKCSTAEVNGNRILMAKEYAVEYGVTLVLKGAGTIVTNGKDTAANITGNAGMSRGGSGDVLSGMIGAVVARGYSPFQSACAGVWIHGLAGDRAAEKLGQEAMLPRDIIGCIADTIKKIYGGKR